MLNGIDWIHSLIKYRYIAPRLTGALVKCKSNDKESFRDHFSRPRKYTSSILAPNQSKVVVGVAEYSKISRKVFPLTRYVFEFFRNQKNTLRQHIPKSPCFIVSVEMQGRIQQIFLRIPKYLGQGKRGLKEDK